jgi:hypothetical protein
MDPIEAVADAITKFEGWRPGTLAYRNRNPGDLRDAYGNYRVFQTFAEGYSALLDDLRHKFLGRTRTGLGPDSTLLDLFMKYAPPADNNPTQEYTNFVCDWVAKATGVSVTPETKLKEIWNG